MEENLSYYSDFIHVVFMKIISRYKTEKVSKCYLCGQENMEKFNPKKAKKFWSYVFLSKCKNCGFVFQNPRLTEDSVEKYYNDKDVFYFRSNKDYNHCEKMFNRGISKGNVICGYLQSIGISITDKSVLEIGCSYGGILDSFRSNGSQVKGIDLRENAVAYGLTKGLDLQVADAGSFNDVENKYDIVILRHVLEHIYSYQNLLAVIKKILKQDGVLYIEVPGINNQSVSLQRSIQPSHIWYFSKDTLLKSLQKAGFKFLKGNEKIQAVFTV